MTATTFTYAIVIAGWGNTSSAIFKGNSFATQLASGATTINASANNNYLVVFDQQNTTIDLFVNGQLVFSFVDTSYQGNNVNYVRFSQYGSSVQVCPAPNLAYAPPAGCFAPSNGVNGGGAAWQNNGNAFNGALTFQATGNDIYVGFFDSANKQNFIYSIVIAGWGNTKSCLYTGNSFVGTATACATHAALDLSLVNNFVILFNANHGVIQLYINGVQTLSYTDPTYQGGSVNWVQYSQYTNNVMVCNSAQTASNYGCYNWTAADGAAGAGHGNAGLEDTLCNSKTSASTQFYFAQGNGVCGGCWCCNRATH